MGFILFVFNDQCFPNRPTYVASNPFPKTGVRVQYLGKGWMTEGKNKKNKDDKKYIQGITWLYPTIMWVNK